MSSVSGRKDLDPCVKVLRQKYYAEGSVSITDAVFFCTVEGL